MAPVLDGINVVAGLWLIVSPWVLTATMRGSRNAWVTGAVIVAVSFLALASIRAVAAPAGDSSRQLEWVNVFAAAWLFVSPWVLALTYTMAWNAWIVGVVVFVLAIAAATLKRHPVYLAS